MHRRRFMQLAAGALAAAAFAPGAPAQADAGSALPAALRGRRDVHGLPSAGRIAVRADEALRLLLAPPYVSRGRGPVVTVAGYAGCPYMAAFYRDFYERDNGVELHFFPQPLGGSDSDASQAEVSRNMVALLLDPRPENLPLYLEGRMPLQPKIRNTHQPLWFLQPGQRGTITAEDFQKQFNAVHRKQVDSFLALAGILAQNGLSPSSRQMASPSFFWTHGGQLLYANSYVSSPEQRARVAAIFASARGEA